MFPPLIVLGVMLGMVPRGWVGVAIVVIGWTIATIAVGLDSGRTGFVESAAVLGGNITVGFAAGLVLLRPIATWIVDRIVP